MLNQLRTLNNHMWDFIELGYEAYNNDVPSILKQNPVISTVQNTVDVSNKFFLGQSSFDNKGLLECISGLASR